VTKKTDPADPIAMVAFHSALRRDLRRTRLVLGEGASRARKARLGRHLLWVIEQLRWHHEGEDVELWPFLAERDARLHQSLGEMQAEHGAIDRPLAALESAARGLVTGWGDGATVITALDELEPPLLAHLRHEEEQLLPQVTRLMTQQEWDDFQQRGWIRGNTPNQTARFLAWLVDRADWKPDQVRRLGLPWPAYALVIKPLCAFVRAISGSPWHKPTAAGVGPLMADEYSCAR
jgi:hypothetical protein